ncbi:MAG: hypothetical protein IT371_19850 [Deltaproteobacteria bacterium]|nr:hypothetical protein [Deltaproteobacteria bacterium]
MIHPSRRTATSSTVGRFVALALLACSTGACGEGVVGDPGEPGAVTEPSAGDSAGGERETATAKCFAKASALCAYYHGLDGYLPPCLVGAAAPVRNQPGSHCDGRGYNASKYSACLEGESWKLSCEPAQLHCNGFCNPADAANEAEILCGANANLDTVTRRCSCKPGYLDCDRARGCETKATKCPS